MGLIDDIKRRFGFGDEWDDDYYEEAPNPSISESSSEDRYGYESPYGSGANFGAVRRRARTPDIERAAALSGSPLRSVPTGPATITPLSPQVRIHNCRPTSFNECGSIADKFKSGTPVILDLTYVPVDQQRRYLDFASGLTYGLSGEINKVADTVFMLTPHNVEMSDTERSKYSSTRSPF